MHDKRREEMKVFKWENRYLFKSDVPIYQGLGLSTSLWEWIEIFPIHINLIISISKADSGYQWYRKTLLPIFFFQNNTKLLLTKAIQCHIFIHYSLIIQGRNPIISKLTRCYTRGCKNAGFRPRMSHLGAHKLIFNSIKLLKYLT